MFLDTETHTLIFVSIIIIKISKIFMPVEEPSRFSRIFDKLVPFETTQNTFEPTRTAPLSPSPPIRSDYRKRRRRRGDTVHVGSLTMTVESLDSIWIIEMSKEDYVKQRPGRINCSDVKPSSRSGGGKEQAGRASEWKSFLSTIMGVGGSRSHHGASVASGLRLRKDACRSLKVSLIQS